MQEFLLMLVILNPFAQTLYLSELMQRLRPKEFVGVHFRATMLSYGVFILMAVSGDFLMTTVFQVRLASMQIFGGLIMLYIAYRYVTQGAGSNLLFRGDISELAPQISLPYMVGPGTIWVALLIGREYSVPFAFGIIAAVLAVNFVVLVAYHLATDRLSIVSETMLGKYFAILMRTNALFIGGVAVEMIVSGIESYVTTLDAAMG